MGMLLSYHEGYAEATEPAAPRPGSKAALIAECEALALSAEGSKAELAARIEAHKAAAEQPAQWSDLTDDELLEAYATNVPDGQAADREAIVAELEALGAEGDDTGE